MFYNSWMVELSMYSIFSECVLNVVCLDHFGPIRVQLVELDRYLNLALQVIGLVDLAIPTLSQQ